MAENLRKRKVVRLSMCFLCEEAGEDVDHILLQFSHEVMGGYFRWFRVAWVKTRIVKELIFSWMSESARRRHKVWDVTPLALMRVIWKERNRRAFEGAEMSFAQLRNIV